MSQDVNSTKIAEKLESYYEIRSATSIEQVMQKYMDDPLITIFSLKFCYIEYIFAIVIATFGLALITMSTVLEREREIRLLIARGMTRKQIVKAVFGEAMLIIVVSFALSIVGGLSIAYGFCQFVAPPEMAIFFTKPQLAVPLQVYTILGTGLTLFLFTSLVTTWYVTRKNLAKILRIYH